MSTLYLKGCIPSPELADAVLSPGDEVWTLNYQREFEKPPVRHFSLHGLREELRCHGRKYLVWLSRFAPTLYMWEGQEDLWEEVVAECGDPLQRPAKIETFPLAEIEAALPASRRYFTGSFAYMLAFALFNDFDEVHIVGVEFWTSRLWQSRKAAAEVVDWTTTRPGETPDSERPDFSVSYRKRIVDDLRGQGAGDESWARECIMYWCGRLEQAGVRVVTYPASELFSNKWIKTHCKELGREECGLYGKCECIGG